MSEEGYDGMDIRIPGPFILLLGSITVTHNRVFRVEVHDLLLFCFCDASFGKSGLARVDYNKKR